MTAKGPTSRFYYVGMTELKRDLSRRLGISNVAAGRLINGFTESIIDLARSGKKVVVRGFGHFRLRESREHIQRIPTIAEPLVMKKRLSLKFLQAKRLRGIFDGNAKLRGIPAVLGPK